MKIKKILLTLGVAVIASMAFVACSSGEEVAQDAATTEVSESAEVEEVEEVAEEPAEVAEEEAAEATNGTDGVYRIEYDQADEQGWKSFLEVTVKDGAIANVNFDEVNVSDDEADNALEQALLTATTPEEFEQMLEGQADAETFKTFIAQLMPQIEQGNKETIIVNK